MPDEDLRSINLNLLPILRALLRESSVTAAARALHLSQSSVSGSLRALREHFGDELLLREGRELVLTPRARELLEPLERLLASMDDLLFRDAFVPERSQARLRIASADYVEVLLAPGLAERLPKDPAAVSVQFSHGSLGDLAALGRGGVDLVVGPRRMLDRALEIVRVPPEEIERRLLWRDEHVVVHRRGTSRDALEDLERYLAAPHAAFRLEQVFAGNTEQIALEALGATQNDRLLLPSFHALLWTVAHSDYLAVVPESLARFYETRFPIAVSRPPLDVADADLQMLWHRRQNGSARHRWLRELLIDVVGASPFLPS